jgi:hypothetical protein
MTILFALQQQQLAAYNDEPFDVTIGVYASEAAAEKAADDMDAAYEAYAASCSRGEGLRHSVLPMPVNTILADVALPCDPSVCTFSQAETLRPFEHIVPGCCGPPPQPVDPGGVLREWRGRTEVIDGPAADAFEMQLVEKLRDNGNVSLADRRKFMQLVGYGGAECMQAAVRLVEGQITELESRFMCASASHQRMAFRKIWVGI